ncbi:MAG: hypothetical protein PVI40_03700 [Chlamydiota bacterium]|jgi:hypothetical protein
MATPILNKSLELKFFDRIRVNNDTITIYKCRGIFRRAIDSLNSARDYLHGGKFKQDNIAFDSLWSELKNKINEEEVDFPFLAKMLKLQGIFLATKWGKNLQGNANYQQFCKRVHSLQKVAKENIAKPDFSNNISDEDKRWIQSKLKQRTFAALSNSGQLPYLYKDLPKGAILLTNVEAHIRVLYQSGANLSSWLKVQKLKKYITIFLTGSSYIHASLSLGKGKIYEQDKDPKESFSSGQGTIHENTRRQTMICPHDILVFNEENQQKLQDNWTEIEQWIEDNHPEIKTDISAMLRIGLTIRKRKKDAPILQNFDFNKSYACSSAIATILAKWDIDVGSTKPIDAISPANLAREANRPNGKLQFLYRSGF